MVIEVSSNPPAVIINGLRIDTAPPVADLLRVIGAPTRVDTGPTRAPTGFRNNQLHVFDPLGVHVNEHHHTRRAQEIGIALSVVERRYSFTPVSAFVGDLLFDGVRMPLHVTDQEFLRQVSWPFKHFLAGLWEYQFDGFCVGFDAVGPRLASGRRSKKQFVIEVSISWPHDPNGPPADGA
jgi:hypothetical protein